MSEWISVKDRMPKHEDLVFTYSKEWDDMEVMTFLNGAFFDNHGEEDNSITYWQPLPEPPKDIK